VPLPLCAPAFKQFKVKPDQLLVGALSGAHRGSRVTIDKVVSARWQRLGATQPFGWVGMSKRAGQYLRLRLRPPTVGKELLQLLVEKLTPVAYFDGHQAHPTCGYGLKHRDPGELEPWVDANAGNDRTGYISSHPTAH